MIAAFAPPTRTAAHLRAAGAPLLLALLFLAALHPGRTLAKSPAAGLPSPAGLSELECRTIATAGGAFDPRQPLRILSWNVRKQSHPDWLEELRQLIEGRDMVMLQEARLDRRPGILPGHRSAARGFSLPGLRTGVTIDSRHTASQECELRVDEPWLGTPKALLAAYFAIEGREESLLAITLHGVNFTLGTAALEKQLAAAESLLRQHRGPGILAGDMNTWSKRRLSLLAGVARRAGLCPVEPAPGSRTRIFGQPVDHVLARGFERASARSEPVESSDHNPLLAELHFATPHAPGMTCSVQATGP